MQSGLTLGYQGDITLGSPLQTVTRDVWKMLSKVLSQIVGQILMISLIFLIIRSCSSIDMLVVYCVKQYNCSC